MTGPTGSGPTDGPDGYRITQTIGHGASSTVYEAVQTSTGRRVALKIVAAATPGGDAERLFTRERAVLAELGEHPHVVSIVDAGEWDGRFWLAMEHCPYGSVARAGEQLEVADAVAVLSGVGSALEAAHRAGLVHCDVKPANILRNRFGSPALADFGIAKFVLATGHGSTATGYTLDHASPEAVDGERPTGASDVWSLGTSLWELLEGRPPFRNSGEVAQSAVIRRICFEPTPPVTREDVPEDLAALIAEMTRKSSDERPSIAEVLARARALEALVGAPDPDRWAQTIVSPVAPLAPEPSPERDAASTATGPSPHELTNVRPQQERQSVAPLPDRAPEPAPRRRPWLVAAAGVLVVVLMGGGGAVTWRMASAASAPAALPAPPTTSTTVPPTTTTTEPPPAPVPAAPQVVQAEAPDTADTGSSQGGSDSEEADEEQQQPQAPQPEAKLGKVLIKDSTCRFRNGGTSCSSTSPKISFSISASDSEGKPITDGCTVTTSLTRTDKRTGSTGPKPCSSRVSFTANGSGDYVVTVNVSWKGNNRAKSFRMVVE